MSRNHLPQVYLSLHSLNSNILTPTQHYPPHLLHHPSDHGHTLLPGCDGTSSLLRLALVVIFLILVPLLSVHNVYHDRRALSRGRWPASLHPKQGRRRIYAADYVPHRRVLEMVYEPLPTRKHFRISHLGNRVPQSGEEQEAHQAGEEDDSGEDTGGPQQAPFRLVFGKQLRGVEAQFKGRSALKGARARAVHALHHPPPQQSAVRSDSPFGLPPAQRARFEL